MTSTPLLTLIVPTHNGAGYIAASIREILQVLERLDESFEVLVVCDGSTDGTSQVAASVEDARVRVLRYEQNRGKGHAICFGIQRARGRLIGMLDSDLDIQPEAILDAIKRFERAQIDAVIGSKRHPDSEVDYPLMRRVLSWGYQILVRILFRVNVRDTQVGAKLFRREMLDIVAPLLLIKHYAFDLELLAVGAEFGFDRVEEMPVRIDYNFTGTGVDKHAVWRMFLDTLAIAYRIHLRHWYVRQFAAFQRERTDIVESRHNQSLTEPVPPNTVSSRP